MPTSVVALGGNALGNTAAKQLKKAKIAAKSIVELVKAGHKLVITHGNGPQVGIINQIMNTSDFQMPLAESTAMSQGYIGYHLTQCINNELNDCKIKKQVSSVLTQVLVDEDDPAFKNPTKPIGNFYTEEEAKLLMEKTGSKYIEDSGRGWRMVVPSPLPIDICERQTIKTLVDSGVVTIACGGGGIPVINKNGTITGIEAVIDKDFAAAKLAELIEADNLFIFTAVDHVKINFNSPDEKPLKNITSSQARNYIAEGHFAPGSMLPKIKAALSFVESMPNRKAYIGSLQKASETINGTSGTSLTLYQ